MDIRQALRTAVRNLFANKARFFHAVLGMVIGIAGFIMVLTAGNLQLKFLQYEEDEYAPSLLDMWVSVNVDFPVRITADDMLQLAVDNPEVISGISPYIEFELRGGIRYDEKTGDTAQLYGVGSNYLDMVPILHLQEGRFLDDMDISRERKVCVVESGIANDLLGGDALGQTLKIWGENYTVVGVLAEVPNSRTRNDQVFIPYTNARKMVGDSINNNNNYEDRYFVCANGKENMYEAQNLVLEMLKERTGRERRTVWFLTVIAMGDTVETIRGYILGGIAQLLMFAFIVLLIGGAGVMNVMLASVQARTKEIGIRKTFGAANKDIHRQFMLEAVITSLVGGVIGIVAGVGGSVVFCMLAKVSLSFVGLSVLPILAALLITVGIGVFFGTYPANQAAKMEIVDCISE